MLAIIKQQWTTNRFNLLLWALALGLLGVGIVATYPGEEGSLEFLKMLESLPESITLMVGDASFSGTIDGWLQMNLYSIMLLTLSFYTIIFISNIVSRELDTGTIEFTLSLPLKRWKLISSRFLVFILCSFILLALIFCCVILTMIVYGYEVDILLHTIVFLNIFIVNVAIGAIALLLSLFFTDYNRSLMAGIGFVLFSYLINIIFQSLGTDSFIKYLSIFQYMDSNSILINGNISLLNVLAPLSIIIVFVGISNIIFSNKEIHL